MPVDYKELKKDRAGEWRETLRNKLSAKARVKIERVNMPERPPMERNRDFNEVPVGFSEEQAINEASRCLVP